MKNMLKITPFFTLFILTALYAGAQSATPQLKPQTKSVPFENDQKTVTGPGNQKEKKPEESKPVEFRDRTDADFKLFKPVEDKQEPKPDTFLKTEDSKIPSTELSPQKNKPVAKPLPKMAEQNG